MTELTSHKQVRTELVGYLRRSLLGPEHEEEVLREPPSNHYLLGVLFPRDTAIAREEDQDAIEAHGDDESGTPEDPLPLANSVNPSAMGLTFRVRADVKTVRVRVRAGIYLEVEGEDDSRTRAWRRSPLQWETGISVRDAREYVVDRGLTLKCVARPRKDATLVTLTLVNRNEPVTRGERDAASYFQPVIEVSSTNSECTFLPSPGTAGSALDSDTESAALLYRDVLEYAVGHGCSTDWETDEAGHVTSIRTEWLPAYEVSQMVSRELPHIDLSLLSLARNPTGRVTANLQELADSYETWMADQEKQVSGLDEGLGRVARHHLSRCRESLARIRQGIALLGSDATVFRAFQLANEAMLRQFAHSVWCHTSEDERSERPVYDDRFVWRPFQIAFILQCLESAVNPSSPDRGLVDLLWFPTGGGKTEAYLGLAALMMFLRRLRGTERDAGGAGVTVLMRYTLRLLTIQQFQRALALISACELLRREHEDELGSQEIAIGLWVGGGATPNTFEEAAEALQELKSSSDCSEGNPYQVRQCPWCGTEVLPANYHTDREVRKVTIHCPNTDCPLSSGIPAYVVDEDVYRQCPSLVIGTVDKFARVPWTHRASALFGNVEGYSPELGFVVPGEGVCGKNDIKTLNLLPPELIIQDELHLISGPLGSLTGLYETLVDELCSRTERPPKIVSSTATIRRATDQCLGLFARAVFQFPPPGLHVSDSFFATQVDTADTPGRVYLGIHAPGRSSKTAMVRVYAALLTCISEIDAEPAVKDAYWTLVGYFNSLRELGGALRLVEDDIPARMKQIKTADRARQPDRREELTSRRTSGEIAELLKAMDVQHPDKNALDVLLATNMISVGVDVSRLGLMVVAGQPKATAEYIQATSRVGRKIPGLVVTVYNWTRPRDRSHFERFRAYHAALYRHVEATSVTPFSGRARDKGLHAILVGLVRYTNPGLLHDDTAGQFDPNSAEVKAVVNAIESRIRSVDPVECKVATREVADLVQWWGNLARSRQRLHYAGPRKDGASYLLHPAGADGVREYSRPTLNSLRDVEPECELRIER